MMELMRGLAGRARMGRARLVLALWLVWGAPASADSPLVVSPTDDMTGRIQNSSPTNYITARNSTTAGTASAVSDVVGQAYSAATWSVYRSVYRFDTSALADDATIDSVLVKTVAGVVNIDNTFYTKLVAAQDTMAVGYFGANTFNNFEGWAESGAYSPTVLSDSLSGSVVEGDTLVYRLNEAGIAEVSKTGTTQFFLLSGNDIGNLDPKRAAEPAYYEDYLIEDDSSYMMVYYGSGSWSRVVNGATPASVNGVSTASIKSVNGVE